MPEGAVFLLMAIKSARVVVTGSGVGNKDNQNGFIFQWFHLLGPAVFTLTQYGEWSETVLGIPYQLYMVTSPHCKDQDQS